jgi:acetylornithine deacetylase/succinyl-diaminopimelate desuccinylase-like protein
MAECAQLVDGMLQDVGCAVRHVDLGAGYPVVVGELEGGGPKTLVIYNHYDVQPPEPLELWRGDPFACERFDGKLWGRGAADDKGDLAARLSAVKAWQAVRRAPLPVNLRFVIEGEEEISSAHLHRLAEVAPEVLEGDGCVWEGGSKDEADRPTVTFGCKGLLYIQIDLQSGSSDLHSMNAAVVENPAWRLTWWLNQLKGPDGRIRLPGHYDDVNIPEASRRAAAAMPLDRNRLLAALGAKRFLVEDDRINQELIFAPTANIAGLLAGYTGPGSKTVLPNHAMLKMDFRLVVDQDAGKVEQRLRQHLKANGLEDADLTVLGAEPPWLADPGSALGRAAAEAAQLAYGQPAVIVPSMAGTGPMALVCGLHNLPVAAFGVSYTADNIHAPDENLRELDYIQGIKHFIATVERFAALA